MGGCHATEPVSTVRSTCSGGERGEARVSAVGAAVEVEDHMPVLR